MLTKKYLKSKPEAKVTFTLPAAAQQAETVHLVGDFNGWNESSHPMKKKRNGEFELTLNLPTGRDYQFRYLVNGTEWHNDWGADKYTPNNVNGDNSIVVV